MNVLTIYYRNYGGGCFIKLLQYIESLLEKGHTVHYISMGPFPIGHPQLMFHRVKVPYKNQYFIAAVFLLFVPFMSLFIVKKNKINLLSVFDWPYAFIFILAKYCSKIPLLTFHRTDWIQEIREKRTPLIVPLALWMIHLSIAGSDKICSVSESIFKNLKIQFCLSPKRGVIIPNNLPSFDAKQGKTKKELCEIFNIPEDSFIIGYEGTLTSIKNVDILIKALDYLRKYNVALIIIGRGSEKKKLKALTVQKKLNEKVFWKDWVKDILPFISGMDLLILPSKFEGCPTALLDALSVGTPCIASNVYGSSEILKEIELLFAPNDSQALYEKLKKILTDNEYFHKIKGLCLEARRRYDFDWNEKVVTLSEDVCYKKFFSSTP